jgi:MAP/microtubule affinity-regulating kinase
MILSVDGGNGGNEDGRLIDDMDQRVSEQVLAFESSHLNTFPPQDCLDDASSHSPDDLSISPAAMFLTAFSPTSTLSVPLPDDEGQLVASYTLGPVVGHGAFSTIRTATSPSGDIVAVKIVRRSDATGHVRPDAIKAQLDNEAKVWASLHHEHILPLFIAEHTPYANYFVTQYCPAGSLYDILKRDGCPALPQDDVGTMFRQVVRGLQYLHEVARFVHGDIKLENVMVDEMSVCKIGDFGMTKKIGESDNDVDEDCPPQTRKQGLQTHLSLMRHNKPERLGNGLRHRNSVPTSNSHSAAPAHMYQRGSLPYASPELLAPRSDSPYRPHPAQDIWALGVLLYILLTGRFPFADSFEPRLQMKILHGM